jgi:hypothetical protein
MFSRSGDSIKEHETRLSKVKLTSCTCLFMRLYTNSISKYMETAL